MSEEHDPTIFEEEIPSIFHSTIDEKPFTNCSVCDRSLLDGDVDYFIEKSMKRYRDYDFETTVFEYAICIHCAEMLKESMSEESRKNMERYFLLNGKFNPRMEALYKGEKFDWENGLKKCIFKDSDIEEEMEYQMVAQFRGDKMIVMQMPFTVGGTAIEEMAELMSNETLDEMDDFLGKVGVPPELRELFTDKPVLVF